MYQVMLNSLVTVSHLIECVSKNFGRVLYGNQYFKTTHGDSLKIFMFFFQILTLL
jgi:hypothetical protein